MFAYILFLAHRRTHVLFPSDETPESVKTPVNAEWLRDVALRDLALHERHAACVDAKGDVYQWGDGFFSEGASSSSERKPLLTFHGKVCMSGAFPIWADRFMSIFPECHFIRIL